MTATQPSTVNSDAAGPKVQARGLYKVFGRRESEAVARLKDGASADDIAQLGTAAVIDASFDVAAGEIFVVMGLSGSGKSTLIRTLNGLLKPSAGQVLVDGTDITRIGDKQLLEVRRRQVSMVFQHFALLPHRSVRDNAAYGLEQQGMDRSTRLERADHWLDVVGLKGWGTSFRASCPVACSNGSDWPGRWQPRPTSC